MEVKQEEKSNVVIQEVEITLSLLNQKLNYIEILLNQKLNYIISKLEKQ
jgi:hypothetical protein